jgi:hypothetical protein
MMTFTTFVTFITEDGRVEQDTYHTRHLPVLKGLKGMDYARIYAFTYEHRGRVVYAVTVDDLGRLHYAHTPDEALYMMQHASYHQTPQLMVMEALG